MYINSVHKISKHWDTHDFLVIPLQQGSTSLPYWNKHYYLVNSIGCPSQEKVESNAGNLLGVQIIEAQTTMRQTKGQKTVIELGENLAEIVSGQRGQNSKLVRGQ